MRHNKIGVLNSLENGGPDLGRRRSSNASISSTMSSRHSIDGISIKEEKYTKKELKEWKQLFSMFDTDGSGAIGNEELKQAMKSIGMAANENEIDNIIREVDADGNGEIDFWEFCACLKKSLSLVKKTNEEMIKECFEIFDQDSNGVITENEFKYVAREIGGFTDELAEKVFRELDVSSNGHLNVEQFSTIMEDYLLADRQEVPETVPKHQTTIEEVDEEIVENMEREERKESARKKAEKEEGTEMEVIEMEDAEKNENMSTDERVEEEQRAEKEENEKSLEEREKTAENEDKQRDTDSDTTTIDIE